MRNWKITRLCYCYHSRPQSLRCLWLRGHNLVPIAFPGHGSDVNVVGETLENVCWLAESEGESFSMTSKLFYCKKCGSFLQLRVEIKIFVNYALQRKEKNLLALLTNTYRRESKRHFTSFPCPYWSMQFKQSTKVVKLFLAFRFFLITDFTSVENYL